MRRLPAKAFMAAMAVVGGYALASIASRVREQGRETPAPSVALAPAEPAAPGSPARTPGLGDVTILRVLGSLESWPNLSAKVRQSVRLGGNHLSGVGEYWQRGVGNLRRTAWRLQSLEGEKTTSYQQIYTGKYLWTDRRLADEPRVTRVDVERVARELNLDAGRGAGEFAVPTILLARGGLSQLVAELNRCFTFDEPVPARHDDMVVDVLIGRWRPEVLEVEWPGLVAGGDWPEHLPHHVLLATGREKPFPYLVEYRRGSQAALADSPAGAASSADPLARYEFFEVHFAVTMPQRLFEYSSNEVKWRDVTARTVERLKSMLPKVASARPEQR